MNQDRETELKNQISLLKSELEKVKARNEAMVRVGLELRTVITSALGYTKLLIRRRDEKDPKLLADALDSLHGCLQQALRQVCELWSPRRP
jgi:hypothetical protein